MNARTLRFAALAIFAAAVSAACTSGQTASVPTVATPSVSSQDKLQLAVGTATIGQAGNTATVGLNVVATFRQPNGNNATGVNTPTLTAPKGVHFDRLLGGSNTVAGVTPAQLATLAGEVRVAASPVPTPYPLASAAAGGFGPFVGVFGYGLAGDNLVSSTDVTALQPLAPVGTQPCLGIATAYIGSAATANVSGAVAAVGAYFGTAPDIGLGSFGLSTYGTHVQPSDLVRSAELALPIPSGQNNPNCTCPSTCGTGLTDPAFPQQYFGGPPAWPSPQGYGNASYFVGYPLGFTDFVATPVAGTYSLAVTYSTSPTYQSFNTLTATANLPAARVAAPLPMFPQPALTINADGSGTLSVDVPSGVMEAVVTVVTTDCDLAAGNRGYDHYAVVTHATGQQTLFLSSLLGPPDSITGQPSHTFCTVSDVQVESNASTAGGGPPVSSQNVYTTVNAVAFDYPAFESSYPFNTSIAPPVSNGDGHTGQADVSTSYPLSLTTTVMLNAGS